MSRFTSRLAIATVAFALMAGFGPGLMQSAYAGKSGGHESSEKASTEHGSADKASADKGSADKGSADKGSADKGSADKGETETETPDVGGSAN